MFRSGAIQVWRSARSASHLRCFSAAAVSAQKKNVGFIGLGNMGSHMAKNLLKNDQNVFVLDLNDAAVKDLQDVGAVRETSPAAIAAQASTIITMLPESAHVQEVYNGDQGIFSQVQPGSLLIDASTIDPDVARSVGEKAGAHDAKFVDAPVSGGVGGAEAGTLTFMVGGTEATFAEAQKVLGYMGANIIHCGPVGSGQVVKICNNMLLAISMIGVSEAMNLGVKNGLDPKLLAGVLNTSTGRCWSSDTYNPCPGVMEGVPSSRGYTGGFGSALMKKDLGLALNAAKSSKATIPLGTMAADIYEQLCNEGMGKLDFSSVYKYFNEKK